MSWPRRAVAVSGLAVVALALLAAGALALTRVSVTPGRGGPRTHFVFRFRAPERTGRIGAIRRSDRLSVSGPRRTRCEASLSRTLAPVKRGAHVKLTVAPRRTSRWCTGRFHARIVRTEALVCAGACPGMTIPRPRTIARFSFLVVKPSATPSPSPGAGPSFAGVKTATLCQAGAPRMVPPSRSYTVGWDAATDPTTPSDKIVYDIYESSTSGAENFSSPLASTGPGQTSYSGSPPGSGAAYFVVRARDAAGHRDGNTVEKMAVNTC
jgi:hypothetical protein